MYLIRDHYANSLSLFEVCGAEGVVGGANWVEE